MCATQHLATVSSVNHLLSFQEDRPIGNGRRANDSASSDL